MDALTPPTPEIKFSPPYLRPNTIHRERLLERLALFAHTRLVLISAPAGYGKTTLLADWRMQLQAQGLIVAWITLEESDCRPQRFLSSVCLALRAALGNASAQAQSIASDLEILAASGFKDLDTGLALLTRTLAQLPAGCVLILDDYHTLTASEIHYATAYLIDHLPAHFKVAIGTRSDPPLPTARLRARDELVELRLADLRFSNQETGQFLQQTLPVPLHAGEIGQVDRQIEGWAVGLQLFGLAMRNWPDWAQHLLQPGESQRFISGYLADEVFQKLEPQIQQFLVQTSILEALYAPLCDAVCALDKAGLRSADILAWLERENLFVIPLDPFGQRYRYHPLFAEFLYGQLQQQADRNTGGGVSLIAELHLRASRWYWENSQVERAMFHAAQAGEETWLVYLLEQTGFMLVARSELTALNTCLDGIREVTIQNNPALIAMRCWLKVLQVHFEQAEADMQQLEHLRSTLREDYRMDFNSGSFTLQTITGTLTALRAYMARFRGAWGESVRLSELALQQLPEDDRLARCTLQFNLGLVNKEHHEFHAARRFFTQAAQEGGKSGNRYIQMIALAFLGQVAVLLGEMQEAESYYRQALDLGYRADGSVDIPAVAYAEAWMGEWYLLQGQVAQARPRVEKAGQMAELCGEHGIQRIAFLLMARVSLAENAPDRAETWVERARGIPLDNFLSAQSWVEAQSGLVLLAQGRLQEAIRWAEAVLQPLGADQAKQANEKLLLTCLRIRLAAARQGLATSAEIASGLRLLETLSTAASQEARKLSLVEIKLLQAGLLAAAGRMPEAQQAGAEAQRLAGACGWTQILADIGLPPVGDKAGSPPQILTERELELLRLVAQGATNQEIAERLYITVGTVKSHINHMFAKLDARHRAEAIAKAHELGLI